MMFRTATIAAILATASYVAADETAEPNTVCYEGAYDDALSLDLGADDCNGMNLFRKVNTQWKAARTADHKANSGSREAKKNRIPCPWGPKYDFAVITGVEDEALTELKSLPRSTDAEKAVFNGVLDAIFKMSLENVEGFCEDALKAAAQQVEGQGYQDWGTVIDGDGSEDGYETLNLDDFFAGGTYLNEETGNFQQDPADFKDNRDKYIYMGENPRLNDHYPTSQRSFAAGKAIGTMYTDESRENFFQAPGTFETCESQTAMCCWHRDRQYFDDNGNCNAQDCANQNPGDNTDLCWTELDGEVFPYPGAGTEKQLHCHGLAWSNDSTDVNTMGKWNTLFYVSMYDHLKQRGYADSIAADPNIMSDQAMCGCVEDMAPVARADCSELVATASYTTSIGQDGVIEIEAVEGTFELEFQACEGFQYKEGVTQEQFAETSRPRDLGLKGKTNDLSAYVYRLWLEENIDDEHVGTVEETLIGYKDPSVNKSDANRAAACEKAFNEKFPGQEYVEKEIA